MSAKIYTKTGDKGKTSLIGGTKVSKAHIRIDAYGTIDELNSFIGLLSDQFEHSDTRSVLKNVQDRLFTIGSSLACDPDREPMLKLPDLNEDDVKWIEQEIDRMSGVLPEMKSFILPGGHVSVSTAHVVRCVCRRAERRCVDMMDHDLFVDPLVIKFINRLSDYLFVLARFIGHELNIQEVTWKPRL